MADEEWDQLPSLDVFEDPSLQKLSSPDSAAKSSIGGSDGSGIAASRSAPPIPPAPPDLDAWLLPRSTAPSTHEQPPPEHDPATGSARPAAAVPTSAAPPPQAAPLAAPLPTASGTPAAPSASILPTQPPFAPPGEPAGVPQLSAEDLFLLDSTNWLTWGPASLLAPAATENTAHRARPPRAARQLQRGFSSPNPLRPSGNSPTAQTALAAAAGAALLSDVAAGAAFPADLRVPNPFQAAALQPQLVQQSGGGTFAPPPRQPQQQRPRLTAASLPPGLPSLPGLRHLRSSSSTGSLLQLSGFGPPACGGLSLQLSVTQPSQIGLRPATPALRPTLPPPFPREVAELGRLPQQGLQATPGVQQALEAVIALPLRPNSHHGLPVLQHLCCALHPRSATVVPEAIWQALRDLCVPGTSSASDVPQAAIPEGTEAAITGIERRRSARQRTQRPASQSSPEARCSSDTEDTDSGSEGSQETTDDSPPSRGGRLRRRARSAEAGPSKRQRTGAGRGRDKGRGAHRHRPARPSQGGRRPPNNPWTLQEHWALVNAVAQCGSSRWADIKRLQLPELLSRSTVDLKDKWRNLQRIGRSSPETMRAKCAKKPETPLDLILRVRELSEQADAAAAAEAPGGGASSA